MTEGHDRVELEVDPVPAPGPAPASAERPSAYGVAPTLGSGHAPGLLHALSRLDGGVRAELVERMQRTRGNAYVARLVAQRQADPPPPPAPAPAARPPAGDGKAPSVPGAGLIVDDATESPEPSQLKRSQFLAQARAAAAAAAEAALASSPWAPIARPRVQQAIEQQFAAYSGQDAVSLERSIRQQIPGAGGVAAATGLVSLIAEQVRKQVLAGLPQDDAGPAGMLGAAAGAVSDAVGAAGDVLSKVGSLLFKRREGAAAAPDPLAVRARLGRGDPLPGPVRHGMESAFGEDFSRVRIHTDPAASRLARELDARAFTVGSDVAFGAGEYAPGTPVGDALLAHELAHVSQQRGADAALELRADDGPAGALEEEADLAAVSAVATLWGAPRETIAELGATALRRMRTGLRLQRCTPAGREIEANQQQLGGRVKTGMEQANTRKDPNAGLWYWTEYQSQAAAGAPGFVWKEEYRKGFSKSPSLAHTGVHFTWTLKEGAKPSAALAEWLGGLTIADCAAVAVAVQYDSIRAAVGNDKFDDYFTDKKRRFKISQYPAELPLKEFLVDLDPGTKLNAGDWYYFRNHRDYKFKHPGGLWQGENAIYMGDGLWRGFGVASIPEDAMVKELFNAYNEDRSPYDLQRLDEKRRENKGELPVEYLFEGEQTSAGDKGKLKRKLDSLEEFKAGGGGLDLTTGWRISATKVRAVRES